MASSNGNISVLLALCAGNSQITGEFPAHKSQWRGALMFSLIYTGINGWVNNLEAGDLRRHRAHYDVIVMGYWRHVDASRRWTDSHGIDRSFGIFHFLYHHDLTLISSWISNHIHYKVWYKITLAFSNFNGFVCHWCQIGTFFIFWFVIFHFFDKHIYLAKWLANSVSTYVSSRFNVFMSLNCEKCLTR